MPSLLARVKKGLKQRKHERKEREAIEKEAKAVARKEYLESLKKERIATLKAEAHVRAKREAHGRHGTLPKLGSSTKGIAKDILGGLSAAGKNVLKESEDFKVPNVDFGFGGGFEPTKKKGKKKKEFDPFDF
jgi:hypothetical protein